MEAEKLKQIIEGALLAAGRPVKMEQLEALFQEHERPEKKEIREAVQALQADYEGRAMELVEVGSGFRIQVRQTVSDWVSRLWEERPSRYSRALLETLALIAYRQPITRSEIEEVRGVSVSTSIIRTLEERGWIKVVGHRDVPGRPAMFGTTREFLDYFNLKSLDELPSLAEIRDIDSINVELELEGDGQSSEQTGPSDADTADTEEAADDDLAQVPEEQDPEEETQDEAEQEELQEEEMASGSEATEPDQARQEESAEAVEQDSETAEPTEYAAVDEATGTPDEERDSRGEVDEEEGEQQEPTTEHGEEGLAPQVGSTSEGEEEDLDSEQQREGGHS